MKNSSPLTNEETHQIYNRHLGTVYRVCFMYMKNEYDADDMAADTFCKLMKERIIFESEEHEKAWLIRVASNLCKNHFRHWWNRMKVGKDTEEIFVEQGFDIDETMEMIMNLPDKYKTAIYLHYYEGYSAVEIAKMLQIKESTIYGHLHTGRKLLKIQLESGLYGT